MLLLPGSNVHLEKTLTLRNSWTAQRFANRFPRRLCSNDCRPNAICLQRIKPDSPCPLLKGIRTRRSGESYFPLNRYILSIVLALKTDFLVKVLDKGTSTFLECTKISVYAGLNELRQLHCRFSKMRNTCWRTWEISRGCTGEITATILRR